MRGEGGGEAKARRRRMRGGCGGEAKAEARRRRGEGGCDAGAEARRRRMRNFIVPPSVSSSVSEGLGYRLLYPPPEISLDVRHLYYRRHPL